MIRRVGRHPGTPDRNGGATPQTHTLAAQGNQLLAPPRPSGPLRQLAPRAVAPAATDDDWPHTQRLLPWLLAAVMVMVFLIPFDSIRLPITLPFDSKLDRFALGVLALVWIVSFFGAGPARPRHIPLRSLGIAVLVFVIVAVASVAHHVGPLVALGQLNLATKKLVLLFAFVTFFYIVATVVRPAELRAFSVLLVVLGAVSAAGTIYQNRAGVNVFFDWTRSILPGKFGLLPAPAAQHFYDRQVITGPVLHGLGDATLLSLIFPFAVVGFLSSRSRRDKLLFGLAVALIFGGTMATLRKSAAFIPAAELLVLVLLRPRLTKQLVPLLVALVLLTTLLVPGALHTVAGQIVGAGSTTATKASTAGRTTDYPAVVPDLRHELLLGRGYGTYDPLVFRILDNEVLLLTVETGLLGIAAYVLMVLAAAATAGREARRGHPLRGPPALAAAAASIGYLVANVLYDALAFPQVPYVFFFVAGLAVVAASPRGPADGRAPAGGTDSIADVRHNGEPLGGQRTRTGEPTAGVREGAGEWS